MRSVSTANFWSTAAEILKNGQDAFLALVAGHTDHSPGTTGAKMLVYFETDTVRSIGTIGGGVMEHAVIEQAKVALANGDYTPQLQTLYHRPTGPGLKSGMICAGTQTNIYCLCKSGPDSEALNGIATMTRLGREGLFQITGSGGLTVDAHKATFNRPIITMHQDGSAWTYQEQLLNMKRVAILGGGHCSEALSAVMRQLGYHVTVIEDRKPSGNGYLQTSSDGAHQVEDYRSIADLIEYPQITHAIVMTTGAQSDVDGILSLLTLPLPFLGIMGSIAKIAHLKHEIASTSAADWDGAKIFAPVGLQIGSHTPEEIAISIAAQIISLQKSNHSLDTTAIEPAPA